MPAQESISDIFLSWRDCLARVVSRILPPHEIEDIVQETYVRACQFESQGQIRSPGALMTMIARNLAIDHIKRAESRLVSRFDEDADNGRTMTSNSADEPFNQAASNEEFAHFCEAVRDLPVKCRRVFVLKKVYGYSQREIARELSLSENTVEKHIAKGMKHCTYYMRQNFGPDKNVVRTPRHRKSQRAAHE
jgi:RNA polymerase sigma-70 factor (ECF subfamily)